MLIKIYYLRLLLILISLCEIDFKISEHAPLDRSLHYNFNYPNIPMFSERKKQRLTFRRGVKLSNLGSNVTLNKCLKPCFSLLLST